MLKLSFIFRIVDTYKHIELINKKALFIQIGKSPLLSTFIKTKYESTSNFFKALRDPSGNIFDAVGNDPVLIASVLGYGEENGRFFIRRLELGIHPGPSDERNLTCPKMVFGALGHQRLLKG